jgi:hypothetical protein
MDVWLFPINIYFYSFLCAENKLQAVAWSLRRAPPPLAALTIKPPPWLPTAKVSSFFKNY